ncbi:MAG: gamma-glutamyltransferase, partial [Anaerolineae bacterium]|nr:gamma-glutamyltransferase [Anaerolineae bacterium]
MDSLIVCPEPRAARVGRDVLAGGGNAVDAAVAAAFAQAVVNPLQCGLGGTALIYIYDARNHRRLALNAEAATGSRPVPESWAGEYAGRSGATGRHVIRGEANQLGYQSIITPGFVRGCWTAFRRLGSRRLSWPDLLSPAARLAGEGFEVYPYVAAMWRKLEGKPGYPGLLAKLRVTPDAAHVYLKPDGSIYREGDRLLQPDLACTIRRLAEAGGDDFYTGEIARAISRDLAGHGAFITPGDLQDYPVDEDRPWCGTYRGLEVTAPPYSFGAQFIEMLQIAGHFDLAGLGHNTPRY